MGRKKKPLLEKIVISDIGAEGKAIARIDNKVLFIPYGIPGDVVDVQVTSTRKKYLEGFIVKYHEHSPDKTDVFCQHFGTCGGCKWQHLPYDHQLKFKQKQVTDSFERIGKLSGYKLNNIKPSEFVRFYRNKLEFTFSDSRWLTKSELDSEIEFNDRTALGFHIPKKFDKILDIEKCYLQKDPSNDIRLTIREYARKNNLSFFNIVKQEGFLRNLIIRTSELNEIMVIISFYFDDKEKRVKLLNHIEKCFPEITSLMYVINQKPNDTILDQDIITYKGKDHIIDSLNNLKFKIGPKSFYQTNSKQTEILYHETLKMASPDNNTIIYDLYCGTGTITSYMAVHCKKAIGIEIIPEAIENAKENAKLNNIDNVHFFTGDVKDTLNNGFVDKYGQPDIIIIDPPRAGLHPDVINILEKLQVPKIIYVSCNPATQARDISLINHLYKVEEILPVDMFPHTHHVENISKLTLK